MEITKLNFKETFSELKDVIEKATFFSIDAEFTGINHEFNINSYDTLSEFYKKTVETTDGFVIIQLGITAFKLNDDNESFKYKSYNFYISSNSNKHRFKCQGQSMHFLAEHNFDFNKLFKNGISFCDRFDAEKLREKFAEKQKCLLETGGTECWGDVVDVPEDQKDLMIKISKIVEEYLLSEDKEKIIDNVNGFQRKLIYQLLETKFADRIFATPRLMENRQKVIVIERKKSAKEEKEIFQAQLSKEEIEINGIIGFSRIIELISKSKKIIVGHNMLLDVMYIIRQFIEPLPDTLKEFKSLTHKTFPCFIDTKYLCSLETFKDKIPSTVLNNLYTTLTKPPFHIPLVEAESDQYSYSMTDPKDHEAGFDSYQTGICFLALVNFMKIKPDEINESSKNLRNMLNKLFVWKLADHPFMNLAGKEPDPPRDHVFRVTIPSHWKQSDLVHHFRNYGPIHVSWEREHLNAAYIALHNREHSPILIKTISKFDNFNIVSYHDYQLLKNKNSNNNGHINEAPKRKSDTELDNEPNSVSVKQKKKNKKNKQNTTSDAAFTSTSTSENMAIPAATTGKSKPFVEDDNWEK